ncbi:hypothetical protein CKQ87_28655, partial [Klebsiella pneumoniae]
LSACTCCSAAARAARRRQFAVLPAARGGWPRWLFLFASRGLLAERLHLLLRRRARCSAAAVCCSARCARRLASLA